MIVIQTTQEKLLAVLQSVSGIVERRNTMPILSNILIKKTGSLVQVTASDLEIQIRTQADLGGEATEFSTTVGARKLIEILRSIPGQQMVSIEVNQNKLLLKSARSRFTLQTLPAQDYPLVTESSNFGPAFKVPQKKLRQLLNQVSFAMALNDIRYYLNGILFSVSKKKLTLVATDGHRLAYACADLETETTQPQEVILPRKTVLELTRLLSEQDGDAEIQFANNQARFSFQEMQFVTKLVEGKFPDYNRVIPKANSNSITLGRETMLHSLQRIAILTSEKFKAVRFVLEPGKPGVLRLTATNTEQEEAVDELEVAYEGQTIDMGFNVSYLSAVLSNMQQDQVCIAVGDSNSSALVTMPGQENFKYVVMPMRI